MQGERHSMPYFVNPKLSYKIQGPEKRFSPVTGFDLLSKTGNAYVARKNGAHSGQLTSVAIFFAGLVLHSHEDSKKLHKLVQITHKRHAQFI